jgi:DNA-binding CsgD family transcriptional regulator
MTTSEREGSGSQRHCGEPIGEPPELEAYLGRLGDEAVVLLEWPTFSVPGSARLSRSHAEVLALVMAGHSSAEIAARRRRSRRTIENQLAAIYAKLGVRGRLQLFAQLSRPREREDMSRAARPAALA